MCTRNPETSRAFVNLHGRVIAVTGATEYLGLNITRELARQGARLRVLARASLDDRGPWPRYKVTMATMWPSSDLRGALPAR